MCFVASFKLCFFVCFWLTGCIVVVVFCVLLYYVSSLYYVYIALYNLDAALHGRSQYSEGPATGHLETGLFRFP